MYHGCRPCSQPHVGSPKNCRHEPKMNTPSDSKVLQLAQPRVVALGDVCRGGGPLGGHDVQLLVGTGGFSCVHQPTGSTALTGCTLAFVAGAGAGAWPSMALQPPLQPPRQPPQPPASPR